MCNFYEDEESFSCYAEKQIIAKQIICEFRNYLCVKENKKERFSMRDCFLAEKIRAYIEENQDEDLTLDRLAEKFHYSKFYIERIFRERNHCTVYKYIQECRLAEAARKLKETDRAIVEIAYEAHYNSQQAFTLAFRQKYLCTPQEYRKKEARMAA